ncbi:hypothetical protein SCG7086_BF_00060 [Chlamydiales bacterium SCGC AG-110-P3]|nr:hypothetical protein SCG7086_BF_00060 [Chlamydiales bacterium SCGC AG-110-P3]
MNLPFKRHTLLALYLTTALSCGIFQHATATTTASNGDAAYYHAPRATISVTPGNQRTIFASELFIPICQQPDVLAFIDLRGVQDNEVNREGNMGIGCRRILGGCFIIGGYLYGDFRSTLLSNKYSQLTAGVELLSEWIDARVNIYIPESVQKRYASGFAPANGESIESFGHLLHVVRTEGLTVTSFEKPLHGYDGEIGVKLPSMCHFPCSLEVRGFIGGYHFEAANVPTVHGPRVRVEATLFDALAPFGWYDVDLSLEAQISHDDIRNTQRFLGLSLTVPLQRPKRRQRPLGLQRRLSQRVQRDVDIVTSVGSKASRHLSLLRTLQSPIGTDQRVMYVDNTAPPGGDGSIEHPFNTLDKGLQAATEAWDIIYVRRGDGTSKGLTGSFVLPEFDDIHIVGSGTDLIVEGILIAPRGNAPLLTAAGGPAIDPSQVQEVSIRGLTINVGSEGGIVASYLNTVSPIVKIQDVTILSSNNSSATGVSLSYNTVSNATAKFDNVSITTTGTALNVTYNNCIAPSLLLDNVNASTVNTAVQLSCHATQAPKIQWVGGSINAQSEALQFDYNTTHSSSALFENMQFTTTSNRHEAVLGAFIKSNNSAIIFRDSQIATSAADAEEAIALTYTELTNPMLKIEGTTIAGASGSSREGAAIIYEGCTDGIIDIESSIFCNRIAGLYVLSSQSEVAISSQGSLYRNNLHAGINLTTALGNSTITLALLGNNTFIDNGTTSIALHNAFSRGSIIATKMDSDVVECVTTSGTGTIHPTPSSW